MASDVTAKSGSYGRFRAIIEVVSYDIAANTSRIRVRGILYNDGAYTAFNNNGVECIISGSFSWTANKAMSVTAGGSQTIIDQYFTVTHNSAGYATKQTANVNIGNTGTGVFGNPPTITVDITPGRIAKVPDGPGLMSNSFTAPSTVNFTWAAAGNNGSNVVEYQLQYADNSGFNSATTVSTGTVTSRSISGLAINKTWYGRSRARNGVGWGGWSATTTRYIPNVPNQVATPSLSFTAPTTLNASWSAPGNGGAAITGYDIQRATSSDFSGATTLTSTSTSISLSGLSRGTVYYVRVRAKNSQGVGSWSSAASYSIPNVPNAPGVPTLTPAPPSNMAVSWSAPTNGGATISSYTVEYATNSSFAGSQTVSATETSVTLTGLTPGSTYWVRVYANNSQGASSAGGSANALMYAGPRVKVGTEYKNTVAYIYSGGQWRVAVPYVYTGGQWKIAGG